MLHVVEIRRQSLLAWVLFFQKFSLSEEVLGMIGSRGCSLAERYGVARAAERIADMFDVDCVAAIARAH